MLGNEERPLKAWRLEASGGGAILREHGLLHRFADVGATALVDFGAWLLAVGGGRAACALRLRREGDRLTAQSRRLVLGGHPADMIRLGADRLLVAEHAYRSSSDDYLRGISLHTGLPEAPEKHPFLLSSVTRRS